MVEEKIVEIGIDVYVDDSEDSKRVEEIFKKYNVPYIRHTEPCPRYDGKHKRPYITIGDPRYNPLGPVSNLRSIEIAIRDLVLPGVKLVDPRIEKHK